MNLIIKINLNFLNLRIFRIFSVLRKLLHLHFERPTNNQPGLIEVSASHKLKKRGGPRFLNHLAFFTKKKIFISFSEKIAGIF